MDQFRDGLGDAWTAVATFVPKLIGFLLILVVGYFIAKAIQKIVDGVLERVGFDNWVERGGIKQALARSQYDASSLMAKLVFFVVMLFVLQLAFGIFGTNPVSDMIAGVVAYLPKVFAAVLILVIGFAILQLVQHVRCGGQGDRGGSSRWVVLRSCSLLGRGRSDRRRRRVRRTQSVADRAGDRQRPLLRAPGDHRRLVGRGDRWRRDQDDAALLGPGGAARRAGVDADPSAGSRLDRADQATCPGSQGADAARPDRCRCARGRSIRRRWQWIGQPRRRATTGLGADEGRRPRSAGERVEPGRPRHPSSGEWPATDASARRSEPWRVTQT